jgi:hypothetical protein
VGLWKIVELESLPTRRLSPHQKPKYRSNQWKKNHDQNPYELVVIAAKLTAHHIIIREDLDRQFE